MAKLDIHFEINSNFIKSIDDKLDWENKTPSTIEHMQNALELYSLFIDGLAQGKVPAFVDTQSMEADKMKLPPLLSQFKYEKEVQFDSKLDIKKLL